MGEYAAETRASDTRGTQNPEIVNLIDEQNQRVGDLSLRLDALHKRLGNVLHYEAPVDKVDNSKRQGMKTPLGDMLKTHNDDLRLMADRIEFILSNLEL